MHDELVKRLRETSEWSNIKWEDYSDDAQETMREAADAIEELSKQLDDMNEANIALYGALPRWIPVGERLPETGVDVLVKFPQNMAVASIDIGEWVVNSGDGWCTDINLAGGEKNPTHWMPLPQGPEEGES